MLCAVGDRWRYRWCLGGGGGCGLEVRHPSFWVELCVMRSGFYEGGGDGIGKDVWVTKVTGS